MNDNEDDGWWIAFGAVFGLVIMGYCMVVGVITLVNWVLS